MTTLAPLRDWLVDYYALATAVLLVAAAVLSVVGQPARRLAAGRSALWGLLALLVLAVLPAWPRFSLAPRRATTAPAVVIPEAPAPLPAAATVRPRPPRAAAPEASASPTAPARAVEGRPAAFRLALPAAAGLATWAFAVGAATATGWLVFGAWQLARLRRRSRRAPIAVEAMLSRIVGAKAAVPALLVSEDLPQPVAAGVARPTIILPARFLDELADRLEAALAHEWAHVRNGDLGLIALSRLLLPALFAHPLYWWLRARIRDDQEALADAVASGVGGPLSYAETLLSWSRNASEGPRFAAGGSAALFERPSQIKRRIAMLLNPDLRIETHCPAWWRIAARAVAASTVVAASLVTLRPPALADDASPAPSKAPAAPAPAADDYTARLLDPEGKPVAGAKVYLDDSWSSAVKKDPAPGVKLLGETGPDGSFRYPRSVRPPLPANPPPDFHPDPNQWGNRVIVMAEGFGPAFVDRTTEDGGGIARLVEDDVPIEGRVVDAQGRPISGASVQVTQIQWSPTGSLDDWLAVQKAGRANNPRYPEVLRRWGTPATAEDALLPNVRTDRDGRFSVRGVGRERVAMLLVEGPGIEATFQHVATREGAEIDVPLHPGFDRGPRFVCHGPRFEFAARPGRVVVGTVTEQGTGKPVAGAIVAFSPSYNDPVRTATTDAEGRYRLDGLRRPESAPEGAMRVLAVGQAWSDVAVDPPKGALLFRWGKDIDPADRGDTATVDVSLPRAVKVRGRLVEKGTGRGVKGYVGSYPVAQPRDDQLGEFFNSGTLQALDSTTSGDDGRFELRAPYGPSVIAARVPDGPYRRGTGVETITGPRWRALGFENAGRGIPPFQPYTYDAVLGIETAEGQAEVDCELALDRGHEVKGRVVGPDGEPLAGGSITGDLDYLFQGSGGPMPSAEFTVSKLVPGAPRDLFVYHADKGLAGSIVVRPDEPGPITLKLQPGGEVTGRLVNSAGKPIAGWQIACRIPYGDPNHESATTGAAKTDAEGRFRFKNLAPGRKHTFITWRLNPGLGSGETVVAEGVAAASGETKDLGDVIRDIHP